MSEFEEWQRFTGEVIRGHRVASGSNRNPRFPGGTLAMQVPFFAEQGLDLGNFHLATLNVSIAPLRYAVIEARHTFKCLDWHPEDPAEDFSFFDCRLLESRTGEWVEGFVYYPHPDTKPSHLQPDEVLEFLMSRRIDGIGYRSRIEIEIPEDQMRIS